MAENLYKYAAQNKLRFPFKGSISVEDLFDLSLENLDVVFKALNKSVKASEEESLLATAEKSKAELDLDVAIAIVKEIFDEKRAEIEAAKAAVARKAEKQRIAEIIARKEDESLQELSIEELKKLLAED